MFVFCYKAVKTASIRSNSGAVQAGLNVDAEAAALENTLRDLQKRSIDHAEPVITSNKQSLEKQQQANDTQVFSTL